MRMADIVFKKMRERTGGILAKTWHGHCTTGQNQVIFETSKIHFPTCEGVSKVSKRANE